MTPSNDDDNNNNNNNNNRKTNISIINADTNIEDIKIELNKIK